MDAATTVRQRLTASQSHTTVISFFLFYLCFSSMVERLVAVMVEWDFLKEEKNGAT